MNDSFRDKFLQGFYKGTINKITEELEEYTSIVKATKEDIIIKLNRLKSTCLNCEYLNDLLLVDTNSIYKQTIIDKNIDERIHDITLKYPKDYKVIESLFILEKLMKDIETLCINYNKYVNVVNNLKGFLSDNNLDPTNIKRPKFQLFKDDNSNPFIIFTPYFTDETTINDDMYFTTYIFNSNTDKSQYLSLNIDKDKNLILDDTELKDYYKNITSLHLKNLII